MKNKINKILWSLDFIIYMIFTYIYRSDGLEYQLAKEGSKLHKVYIHGEPEYSYLYYNSASPMLSKIGLMGMLVTSLIFIGYGTYLSTIYIKKKVVHSYNKFTNIVIVIVVSFLYALLLHILQRFIYINFCMLVGE